MKNTCIITAFAFLLSLTTVFAHQDWTHRSFYSNVGISFTTGFGYEEIKKAMIIGQLAEKLSKELHYNEKIDINLKHFYIRDCEPDYFVAYDKGKLRDAWSGADSAEDLFTKESIVIRGVAYSFDVVSILKLVEYAIQNIQNIKSSQKLIEYHENYCQWILNSIDTVYIKELLLQAPSNALKKIIETRIDRPEEKSKYGTSYYWQNEKYHIIYRDYNDRDTSFLMLDRIFIFYVFENSSAAIFDTDSSFYMISFYNSECRVSKRHVIKNTHENYKPYFVNFIGDDKYSIFFWYYSKEDGYIAKNRTLLYLADKDELIQDLDKIIEGK